MRARAFRIGPADHPHEFPALRHLVFTQISRPVRYNATLGALPAERRERRGLISVPEALFVAFCVPAQPPLGIDVRKQRLMPKQPLSPIPDQRGEILVRHRNLKMARSAHAYVRGSTTKFYEWLEGSSGKVPSGPSIWICGDCHVGNLGPLADSEAHVDIQIRDLDQTVIGNPAHDLIRLGLSLASAARGSDLPGATTAHMLEEIIEGYQQSLNGDFDNKEDKANRPKPVQLVLQQSLKRRWRHLAQERIEDVTPTIPLGKRFWALSTEERNAIKELFDSDSVRALVVGLKQRDSRDPIEILDAAYWRKGCSSLGRLRNAVLVGVGKGRHQRSLCLLDIKEALAPDAPRDAGVEMPRDHGQRIVAGAQALSPNLGERMLSTRLLDKAVVLRELMPQDLKIEIDRLTRSEAMKAARYLASVVGLAHRRQMDAATSKSWSNELARSHTKTLEAPSWLWSSVVELAGIHEMAYLEHCRRYAMTEE